MNDRTIITVDTVAGLRSIPGPEFARYVFCLETGKVYRWIPGSALTDDGTTTITSLVGGYAGAWVEVRRPDKGADLTDAAATLTVGGGRWRRLPVSTLSTNRAAVLDPTNAEAGDTIEVTREDVSPYTYTLTNGGTNGGTVKVMPAGSRSFVIAYFDGTDFVHRKSALML